MSLARASVTNTGTLQHARLAQLTMRSRPLPPPPQTPPNAPKGVDTLTVGLFGTLVESGE